MLQEEPTATAIHLSKKYLPIQDYAVISNLRTVALVGKNGSIDWCCLHHVDSSSIFGALLDADKGGFFCITPFASPEIEYKQLYLPDTNILITRFLTAEGVGEIIDFMPIKRDQACFFLKNGLAGITWNERFSVLPAWQAFQLHLLCACCWIVDVQEGTDKYYVRR
jgi:GH15 family glucan-1,4-alpha-glucosidase